MSLAAFSSVTKEFAGKAVLDGLSFAIPRRSRAGLVGENGSGKSTILKLIARKLKPVPLIGAEGIPLRDEIELEMMLK